MKLKELQESGKYPTEEMTAYTMEQAGVKPETQTTRPIGVGVRAGSSNLVAGNYQNIAGLNARQRRLLRKYGGQYVGRNGQVYFIGPGTSRADMRKIYLQ